MARNVRAVAVSRCEVSGQVYLPGDPMLITEEQFAFLDSKGAARRETIHSVLSPLVGSTDTDIEEVDRRYFRRVGKPRPKKER